MYEKRTMSGRKPIITDDTGDIVKMLQDSLNIHNLNRNEIDYLYNYYKGNQPILNRVKEIRPEICNRIVENRANEIVSFKVGYLCGEPIQYISRSASEEVASGVSKLNEYMFSEDKATCDQEIVEWQMICGTAFRMILPDNVDDMDESPFEIYTLDPRNTFIIYSNEIGNKPIMGVTYTKSNDTTIKYSIYTKDYFYIVENDILILKKAHSLGCIPIFEYPANNSRLGAFEIVLPLLDAINDIASNRLDGIEQTIQAFIKFINCDITKEEFEEFKELGAIKVKSTDGNNADVEVVCNELNQTQTQTLKDDIYNAILTICGIPNRNGNGSTSDTGAAVLLRDGWSLAESRAKDSENIFKRSEKKMLKLVLNLCNELRNTKLKLGDIELKFTRRNYEAIQSKSQVLVSMLQQDKIHPQLAFTHCGMFSDPESAYQLSRQYFDEVRENYKTQNRENYIKQTKTE